MNCNHECMKIPNVINKLHEKHSCTEKNFMALWAVVFYDDDRCLEKNKEKEDFQQIPHTKLLSVHDV